MPANRAHIPTPNVANSWPHLTQIATKLMPLNACEVGLLIGYNCPQALMPKEIIPPDGQCPFGQRTDLGWSIVGIVSQGYVEADAVGLSHRIVAYEVPSVRALPENYCVKSVLFSVRTSVKEIISSDVLNLLERDFRDSPETNLSYSQEDLQFLSILEDGIAYKQGHYEMPLPFRSPSPVLPNNRALALSRLRHLQRRLQTNERFRYHYSQFMEDLMVKGHAEKVVDTPSHNGTIWYIPHHGVYNVHKPDKIRVVFDCSSVYQGHSLNQHLLQGPDLTNKLVGVICRFRKEPVAILCDIEQMFYQFKVSSECRDYLRFLWWDSNDYSQEPVDFRMTVHLFGATSSPGCANFGLKRIALDNEGLFGSAAADFIQSDFYVDDGVKSLATVREAISLIEAIKSMCSKGGLRLHKFVSNKKEVIQSLAPEDRAKDLVNIDLVRDKLPIERALGVSWCIESDTFQFHIALKDRPLTRRGILSSVSCLYDPLGLIAPVILLGKQILQQMCASKAGWDDPLPEQLHAKWQRWWQGLHSLASLKINRCVNPESFGEVSRVELHHFSDASSVGYGQCSYIRLVNHENTVHCALLMGKSRVIPLKPITIPRLELVAAVLSVKIGNLLQQELRYEDITHVY
ncbi:uncharacterized protein LOC128554687 [Mercenaria mercenaria]|uniref:uncharacterized protein LOC128554687 n=1 Tax=Mercenaria mercenaria TaxID=6596 RepID=UPI00234FA440|nr:uncharacterized protein LOC128554687 [Mercenaria mercenaria]